MWRDSSVIPGGQQEGFNRDMIFSHPALKACNMQYYFKWFLVLQSSEVIFISDQKVKVKSNRNRIRNYIFSFPWESQGSYIGSFLFLLHISVITSPTNGYLCR